MPESQAAINYLKKQTCHVRMVFSDNAVRTSISTTRYDTAGSGIYSVHFLTDGALTSVNCTEDFFELDSAIDSGTTFTAGSILIVRDAKKVKCTSHGVQMVYLNA